MKLVLRSVLNEIREGAHRAKMNGRSVERVELSAREYAELQEECSTGMRPYPAGPCPDYLSVEHIMGIPIKVVG